jgi:hypothetical protein
MTRRRAATSKPATKNHPTKRVQLNPVAAPCRPNLYQGRHAPSRLDLLTLDQLMLDHEKLAP